MGIVCPLVVLLLQCWSILCFHLVNILSLSCFYRESLLLWQSLLVSHMLVGFVPSSLWMEFLFLIFLRTESTSWVNGPSLMSNCLLIILVIGSCVTFGGFPGRFLKCCFHSFILSCWFIAFNLALADMLANSFCAFLVLEHLCLLGSSYSIWRQFSHLHVFL